jgi:NADH:ubiquinone oxidoreductase subunit E
MAQKTEMHICLGSSCFSRGNKDVVAFIKDYLHRNNLEDKINFKGARCMGHCSDGPNLRISEEVICGVSLQAIENILDKKVANIK